MNLIVYTFITYNCSEYAEYLHKSLELFKSGNNDITYYGIASIGTNYWPKQWMYAGGTNAGSCGSESHIKAIDIAKIHCSSKDSYIVFVDTDMCILHPGWDDAIVRELQAVDVWGGGYNIKTQKPNGFPSPHLFCFHSSLVDKVNLDFSMEDDPKTKSCKRHFIKPGEEYIYGRPVGAKVKCDTGWKLPMIFHKAGLKWGVMDMMYSKFHKTLLPFGSDNDRTLCEEKHFYQMAEWQYNKKLFATHKKTYMFAHGHKFGEVFGRLWRSRIDLYTHKEFGFYL